MIKNKDILNEGGNTNAKDKSSVTKQTNSLRLQELTGAISETKSSDPSKPNPQKAPLNYIENMGEWEKAKKDYEESIAQIQLQLSSTLSEYEDKGYEIDRFKEVKTELEKELIKIMGVISNKLIDYDDIMIGAYSKIEEYLSKGKYSNETQGDCVNQIKSEEINEGITQFESKENEIGSESPKITKVTKIIVTGEENISDVLNSLGIPTEPENSKSELFDDVTEIINRFLFLVEPENWKKYKRFLRKKEIVKIKKLHSILKNDLSKYQDLLNGIKITESKIDELENEETSIGANYNDLKRKLEKMTEASQELNKTYFLNSYLSTKNIHLEDFISSPIVEKQIGDIIKANIKGLELPKTILLYGKPNLGKTYAANVLASELGRKMYHIKSYDIFTGGFSDPNAMLEAIFTSVISKKEPCIIFLDEIESFISGYAGSPYQNLIENTIRHHISKIKESDLDIMIIGAISEKNKISPCLLKQDIFSKQIYFDDLPESRCIDFINKLALDNGVTIGTDVDVEKLVNHYLKDSDRNQEYIKKLMNIAIDSHRLNSGETDDSILSQQDFSEAIRVMRNYSHTISQNVGF